MDLNKIRTNAAKTDMNRARKYGCLSICGTLIGNLDLSYENGCYTLTKFGGELVAKGAAKYVAPALAASYEVVGA